MARQKLRTETDVRKILDLDKDTIKILTHDAVNRDLQGFKPNAERILKEAAAKLKDKK
jgi:hypothetical protein